MNSQPIKLIIADDNHVFRQSLTFYLTEILNYTVLAEACNGTELLELENIPDADLLLIDIEMPGLNGIESNKQLTYMFRGIKCLAMSADCDKSYLEQLMGAGFKGYVHKGNIYNSLPDAIDTVMRNEYYYSSLRKQLVETYK